MLDSVIIGRGPAGISAALYILRAGFNVKIIAKGGGALEKAERIENYFGFKMISGNELLKLGDEQIKALGGQIVYDEVTGVSFDGNYTINCAESEYRAKTVIIATGASRKKTDVKNAEKFEGVGISYCAVCDAFFYRGKTAAVLGNGSYALHEASELNGCSELYLLTNGEKADPKLIFPQKIKIITEPILELNGGDRLESVTFINGESIKTDGLFIAEGVANGADFARTLGLSMATDGIMVDSEMRTAAPGVFAAGDVTGGVLQISTAVGEGAKAGLSAVKYLRELQAYG